MRVMVEERRRLETALAVSVMVHVAAAMWLGTRHLPPLPAAQPPLTLIPVSLVGHVGGGGGERGPAPAAPPVATPAPAPPHPVHPKPAGATVASRPRPDAPALPSLPSDDAATSSGSGQGTTSSRGGGGDGTGGDGSGGARIAYGSNPKPPYPMAALRLHIEGTVLLDVTVEPDGHPSAVRVQHSSGNAALDESALATVRDRWRFIPARVAGVAVEGPAQVPIRFRLTGDED